RLLAEDSPQELLFGGQFSLALGRDLADQNIARRYFRADADDAVFVQILQRIFTDVGDVAGDLFRPQLGFARFDLMLLNMDRGVLVFLYQAIADQDGILEVAAFPTQVGDDHILAQGQFAVLGARTVGQHIPGLHDIALIDGRALIDTSALVRAVVLAQAVDPA